LAVEVQIFGTKKDSDTRKALRFFSERRVRTHFVDLQERAASLGELKRFAQKFGADALIARSGNHFAERGLGTARYSDERWLELLADDPFLLRIPLARWQHRLTIGLDEAAWKDWVAAASTTPPGKATTKP
jgi:arsenate reductase (glutaredoxin)